MQHKLQNRKSIKIAGESGQGINVTGEILVKSLKNCGYNVFGYREYPSLIRGGHAAYQIDISDQPINSPTAYSDILICFSRRSIHAYLETIEQGGLLIHTITKLSLSTEQEELISSKNIQVEYLDAFKLAKEAGGNALTINVLFSGVAWKILQCDKEVILNVIKEKFASKPQFLEMDLKVFEAGFNKELSVETDSYKLILEKNKELANSKIIGGNEALSLGALKAGVRAMIAYPMTPSSSILSYLGKTQHKTGIAIKQAEDEITAAQMTLGAMHMGTRALTATSGGGFDLMTETVSLSGITEIPFVCVIAQRPGPATGLPTWTAAGDLSLAIYSAHGEFPRCVIAASDAKSASEVIQQAYNIAEVFQIPVLVLTEKQVAESLFLVDNLDSNIKILRGLVDTQEELDNLKDHDRYALTKNGVSNRWIPGSSDATFNANSDEHTGDGTLTEDAQPSKDMMDKRMRKQELLLEYLPEPKIYGPEKAKYSFVGWGSPKNTIIDTMQQLNSDGDILNYLHYEYIYPFKSHQFLEFANNAENVILIENNYMGQLGKLITSETSYQFDHKLLKYDGRPFFVEDIINFIENLETNV